MSMTRPGFTLIEMMVVVVVLSILAALAIPTLSRARDRSYRAAMTSDLKHLITQQELYYNGGAMAYKTAGTLDWTGADPDLNTQASEGVTIELGDNTNGWAATATHAGIPSEQCNVYMGDSGVTIGEATVPGVIACTNGS